MLTLRGFAADGVKVAAAGLDCLVSPRHGVTILLYHRVGGGSGRAVDLSRAVFAEQMEYLASHYAPLSLDGALDLLVGAVPRRPESVVVTFDDGTADFADCALPLLVANKIPATVFLATAFVEEQRAFPDGGVPLSWAALRDATSTGWVTVGSHTHDHMLFDRIDPFAAADQLDRSVGLIGDRLGVRSAHFAYPKALAPAPPVEWEVRKRFRSASLAGTRSNDYGRTDPYRLRRSPIQTADRMRWFARKAAGGMAFEDRLRQIVVGRRYRGRVT